MADKELANLRRARSRCHAKLKQAEALAEGYRTKLADLEARIRAIAPELDLPVRHRKPNPIFARGELSRRVLDMLREAGQPPAVREMAVTALAAKGVRFPDRRTMKYTRVKVSIMCAAFERRGLLRTVGVGKATKRVLAEA